MTVQGRGTSGGKARGTRDEKTALALPAGPATAAAQRLELARLYLRNGMEDKGVAILRQLIAKYGSTKASHEAKILLIDLRPLEK